MNKRHNIDELFRDNLQGYSAPAPENAWEKLEHELAANKAPKAAFGWIKIAASILLIGGTVAISLTYLLNQDSDSQSQLAENKKIETQSQINKATNGAERSIKAELNTSENSIPQNTITSEPENVESERLEKYKPIPETTLYTSEIAQVTNNSNSETSAQSNEKNVETMGDNFPTTQQFTSTNSKFFLLNNPADNNNKEPELYQPAPTVDPNDLIMQENLLALNSSEKKEKMNWSVGGQAGPQYTYREVYMSTSSYPVEDYDQYESGVLAYAGGIDVEMQTKGKFAFQSGVFYSKIGQEKSTLQLNDQFSGISTSWSTAYQAPSRSSNSPADIVNSTGDISFDKNLSSNTISYGENISWEEGIVTAQQFFEFIEVPFIVQYKLLDNKLDINVSSGIWANFLIGNKAYATDNLNYSASGKTNNINTINYSGSVSLGLDYPLTSSIAISLEPFFKYYLTPINTNPETSVYPYSMGVMSGVRYSF